MFFRRAKGLSQSELAELSNISVGYVGKIERGEANPSLDVYWRVAAALGVKFEEICKED